MRRQSCDSGGAHEEETTRLVDTQPDTPAENILAMYDAELRYRCQ